jgi:hypothetical protein
LSRARRISAQAQVFTTQKNAVVYRHKNPQSRTMYNPALLGGGGGMGAAPKGKPAEAEKKREPEKHPSASGSIASNLAKSVCSSVPMVFCAIYNNFVRHDFAH